jgi:hypothetical protein
VTRPTVSPVDSPPPRNNLAQTEPGQAADLPPERGKRETILNQHFPADGRSSRYAAWGVVLLVLVQLGWRQLRPESELRRVCAMATAAPASRLAVMEEERFDHLASQADDGNVLLKLAGYARTNSAVENTLGYFYFRTTYAMYPRRLFAGPADQIINGGRDIMRIGFNPDPQWLQAHDVHYTLTFGDENLGWETPRLEPLPSPEASSGMSANK